jgi:hypothetical protein
MVSKLTSENLAYHASRLLLLISLCGKPRSPSGKSEQLPGIEGRTLLAKLDFFVRYPAYLKRSADVLGIKVSDEELGLSTDEDIHSVEAKMVRFLYGPWDHIYYLTIAYLIGKSLIEIEKSDRRGGVEIFRLTVKGQEIVWRISEDPMYVDLALRANTTYHLFNKYSGNKLKEFIYSNFPEVVSRKIGTMI